MLNKYKNIIFDLDGTLIESHVDIFKSLEQAFSLSNIDTSLNNTLIRIGPPLPLIIKEIKPDLSNEEVETIVRNFREIYNNSNFPNTILYEGIKDLLITLKRQDKNLFIATNKTSGPTLNILKKLDILQYFTDIITLDKINSKRDMVEYIIDTYSANKADECILIGDSMVDMLAAYLNNIDFIGCKYGYDCGGCISIGDSIINMLAVEVSTDLLKMFKGE